MEKIKKEILKINPELEQYWDDVYINVWKEVYKIVLLLKTEKTINKNLETKIWKYVTQKNFK